MVGVLVCPLLGCPPGGPSAGLARDGSCFWVFCEPEGEQCPAEVKIDGFKVPFTPRAVVFDRELDRVQALGLGDSKFFDFFGVVESLRVIKGRILKKFRLRGGKVRSSFC